MDLRTFTLSGFPRMATGCCPHAGLRTLILDGTYVELRGLRALAEHLAGQLETISLCGVETVLQVRLPLERLLRDRLLSRCCV